MSVNGLRITGLVLAVVGVLLAVAGSISYRGGGSHIPYLVFATICPCAAWVLQIFYERNFPKQKQEITSDNIDREERGLINESS